MTQKRVFIDMDNTLCDYRGRYEEWQNANEKFIPYPQSQYGFFSSLDPLPGAIDAYQTLEQHPI